MSLGVDVGEGASSGDDTSWGRESGRGLRAAAQPRGERAGGGQVEDGGSGSNGWRPFNQ